MLVLAGWNSAKRMIIVSSISNLSGFSAWFLPGYRREELTFRESLRDIETCLQALGTKVYHCGIRAKTARSTLADANEKRDWRIFADFAKEMAYALDSTTIDLCLSLFPWAKFRRRKAAIKLHTLLALRGSFPTAVIVTTGKIHDVNILDQLQFAPGAF